LGHQTKTVISLWFNVLIGAFYRLTDDLGQLIMQSCRKPMMARYCAWLYAGLIAWQRSRDPYFGRNASAKKALGIRLANESFSH